MRLPSSLVAVVVASAVTTSAAGAEPCPRLLPARQEEDWSCLAHGRVDPDYADPLKYLPYVPGEDGFFVSFGGSARWVYEVFRHPSWGAEQPRTSSFLQRYLVHGDAQVSPHLRVFGQLTSALESGREPTPRPIDVDRLDGTQLFIEGRLTGERTHDLRVRVGRQELKLGAGRMVAIREGPNTRQVQDGVVARGTWGIWGVDGFVTVPVQTSPGVFDNPRAGHFGGGQLRIDPWPELSFEAYAFTREQSLPRGLGQDARHTVGGRIHGHHDGLSYDLEGAGQVGRVRGPGGDDDIAAWTLAGRLDHRWRRTWGKPSLGTEWGVVSGDRAGSATVERFQPPFPRGAYFGLITALGPGNTSGFRLVTTLEPIPGLLRLSADGYFFWRTSVGDGLYGVPGNPVRPALGNARHIGQQPQLAVVVTPDRHTNVTLLYARFFAGPVLRDAPPARDIDFATIRMSYAF